MWINPNNTNHLIIGNDGGLNVSYDQAATWEFVNTITASQFYAVAADMRKPYYVCGGLQDNGSWCGPSQTRAGGGGGAAVVVAAAVGRRNHQRRLVPHRRRRWFLCTD